ncbi:MAG: hypothetical protein QGF53_09420 [Alphaproteobacteria bacterium]|nr:hypothetical protein [Alphaproteobacteria bacterium]
MPDPFAYRLSLAPEAEAFRPEIQHACDFLDGAHGLVRDGAAARVLHYGAEPPAGAHAVPAVVFPHLVRIDAEGLHPDHAALDAALADGTLESDPLGLIFLMLSRLEERDAPHHDRMGRARYTDALACRLGKGGEPLVDRAARDLARALTGQLRDTATAYEVLVTHDVDRLRGYHRWWQPLRYAAGDAVKRRSPGLALRRLQDAYVAGHPWRSARALMDLSESHGLQSRFYFMGPSNRASDSPYAVTMVPLLRAVAAEVAARGHVIGFHPGFGTQTDPALWRSQRDGLEAILDRPLDEGRQHGLGYDAAVTPDIWDGAGMRLDSTLGYPESTGFRAGTTRRFAAYSLRERRRLSVQQLCTPVMDFGLFDRKYRNLDHDMAMAEAERAAAYCREFGGTLVLLNHAGQSDARISRFFGELMAAVA